MTLLPPLIGNIMENMETMSALSQIVQTVGFPIVWSFVLFWFIKDQERSHKEEVDKLSEVIAENNIILHSLKTIIEEKLK